MNDSFIWMTTAEVKSQAFFALAAIRAHEAKQWDTLIAKRRKTIRERRWWQFWIPKKATDQQIKSWYAANGHTPRPWNWCAEARLERLLLMARTCTTGAEMMVSSDDYAHMFRRA